MNYTGVVANDGTVTLTNVLVYNNRSGTAPILTVPILVPGATANFSGSYHVPLNCCSQSYMFSIGHMLITRCFLTTTIAGIPRARNS